MMRFLGQSAGEIAGVLESPTRTSDADIERALNALAASASPLLVWPEPGSRLEEALLCCAEVSFLNARGADDCRAELRRLLSVVNHAHLIRFLSFVKLAHLWIEACPEVSYEKIREALDSGMPVFEWIHRNSAGEDIHCEVRLMRLPGAECNLILGSVTDITERKRAEGKPRESEERVRLILDSTATVSRDFTKCRVPGLAQCTSISLRPISQISVDKASGSFRPSGRQRGTEITYEWLT